MSDDIEVHKEECRELYEKIIRAMANRGLPSSDLSLAEQLFKKTSPQNIIISRQQRVREMESQLKQKDEKIKELESIMLEIAKSTHRNKRLQEWYKAKCEEKGVLL